MSEPIEVAPAAELVTDGLWHWRIANSAIGGHVSSSHALVDDPAEVDAAGDHGCILVDPVHLHVHAMQALPRPRATCLTARTHQRSAWRYRASTGATVWLPRGSEGADEEPDHRYGDGDLLPGGLVAIHTPGPEQAHYCLHQPERGILLCSDLVSRDDADGELSVIDPALHEDPEATAASIERLLELDFEILCLAHGAPVVRDAHAALAGVLAGRA